VPEMSHTTSKLESILGRRYEESEAEVRLAVYGYGSNGGSV
jgi:hypothetical protein